MSGDVEAADPNEVKKELVRALLLARSATNADAACKYDVCVKYYDEAHVVLSNLLEGSSLIYLISDSERELLAEKVCISKNVFKRKSFFFVLFVLMIAFSILFYFYFYIARTHHITVDRSSSRTRSLSQRHLTTRT